MSVLYFTSQFDEIFINWIITIFDAFHRKSIISQVDNYDRIQIININSFEGRRREGGVQAGASRDDEVGIVFGSDMSDDTECHQIWAELETLHCNLLPPPSPLSSHCVTNSSSLRVLSQTKQTKQFPDWGCGKTCHDVDYCYFFLNIFHD